MPNGIAVTQDDAEELEAGEHLTNGPAAAPRSRSWAKASPRTPSRLRPPSPSPNRFRAPGDDHADRDRDQACRNVLSQYFTPRRTSSP